MRRTHKKDNRPRARPRNRRAPRLSKEGRLFEDLVALQARLRAPNGCPWDREQTHSTLRTYLLEETYEVLDALDSGDDRKLAAELGDLLLQVVFHAQIAREEARFSIADVIQAIHSKLVRRHPHVFGSKRARSAAEVLKNWEQLKAEEREEETAGSARQAAPKASLLDGIPKGLPATLEAFQMTRRAARIGFDWDSLPQLLEKMPEEAAELRQAFERGDAARIEDEVGDLLFAAVNAARFLDLDPEIALRRANEKFRARFWEMERRARETGRELADVQREEMEQLWEAAKHGAPNPEPRPK
jgi:MazG family protein